ncbi:RNA-BINDING PROTEIN YLMH-RELATED [Salix viminalis]|uniref:RNA-BINDING PROTEIN YLMH-RELATED n=1 Tax=Salix viminalis TaxID=40686 RepID=A0A9Q0Z7X6_SALVM|nr:RNA-BINDING PROTEIN YLMH-RELATED [Salix viminalis]
MDVLRFLSVQSIKRQVPEKCAWQILLVQSNTSSNRTHSYELINQSRALKNEGRQYKSIFDEKKKEMEPLQQALGKLRTSNNAGRVGICSTENELNDLLMGVDLDGVRKERQALWEKLDGLDGKVKALDADIKVLQDELEAVFQKREKTYETLQELRKQRDEGNANFYQSRMLLTKAKELAARKDVKALEELAIDEVEKFMSLWSHNKSLRDDYVKRILPSLDRRQMSRDGRIRNPDEKPLVILETPKPSEPEPVAKPIAKRAKEEPKPAPLKDTLPTQKAQKEIAKTELKPTSEHSDIVDKEISGLENLSKNPSPAEKEVDEAKLKEIKREEEIAKAKQAMERKKKLAEKAAAKAAARAQKDVEKKLKDREKKLKKKAAASTPATEPEETAEAVAEAAEPEMVEVNDEVPVSVKEKVRKENTVRSRNRPRVPDSLPKVIMRRKKSTNVWMWAAPAAAFVVLVLLALGYYYLF